MNQEMFMKHKPWFIVKMVLMVLCFLLLVYIAFIKRGAVRMETLKVGGPENMKLVEQLYKTDAYKQQQKTAIEQVLGTTTTPTADTTATTPTTTPTADATTPTSTVDKATLASIEKNGYVLGKAGARITILEYSDLLCPFCKKESDDKILDKLVAQYGGDVNVIFQHYIVHQGADILAEDAQCVGEQLGSAKFYSFIQQLFDLTDKSDASVLALAKTLGVKEATFTQCVTSGKYSTAVNATSDQGRTLFGVTGTPGNVIIDNQKGTFTLIAGAYPIENFQSVINGILGK